jgi:hypothetical protein
MEADDVLLLDPTRADAEGPQLDLPARHTVDEEMTSLRWWLLSVLMPSWLTTSKVFLH